MGTSLGPVILLGSAAMALMGGRGTSLAFWPIDRIASPTWTAIPYFQGQPESNSEADMFRNPCQPPHPLPGCPKTDQPSDDKQPPKQNPSDTRG